jgi:hypothetical protein
MRKPARWAATLAAGMGLITGAALATTAPAPASTAQTARTMSYYAFDINNGTTDPGFVPVPGSNPKVFAQGDELIINDRLTTTRRTAHGYPVIGYDSGVCTLTRIPEAGPPETIANCVVTAVVKAGSLAIQGVVRFSKQHPEPAVLAVTGGSGRFGGAAGTVAVSFRKDFKILTFKLR